MNEIVLILDDEVMIRKLLVEVFRSVGVATLTSEDALVAYDMFLSNKNIRAVVSDLQTKRSRYDGQVLHVLLSKELKERPAHFVLLHGGFCDEDTIDYFNSHRTSMVLKSNLNIVEFGWSVVDEMRQLSKAQHRRLA